MTIRYADSAGSNTSPYDTWAKAATNPQTIIDLATAGDENRYRGTFTLSAALDFDTNNGDETTGRIIHRGYDTDGTYNGVKSIFDGNSSATNCAVMAASGHWLENLEFKNATGDGVDSTSASADSNIWVNCSFNNNGSDGWAGGSGATLNEFYRCQFYSNTNRGFNDAGTPTRFYLCVAYANGDEGFYINFTDYHVFWACCACDNGDGDDNIEVDAWSSIINCVIDGTNQTTETGLNLTASQNVVIANRITNCATGINAGSKWGTYGWNLFHNNSTADTSNDAYFDPLPYTTDTDTNEIDPDADDGYNNTATRDHNLKAIRTYNGDGNDVVGLGMGS